MVVGVGLDLVEVARIRAALDRHGERFLNRCFTPAERDYCASRGQQRDESLAARYAAKEACWKALGVPPALRWVDMEVTGKGAMRLHRLARDAADRMGVERAMVSLTHAAGVAAAVVILETRGPGTPGLEPQGAP